MEKYHTIGGWQYVKRSGWYRNVDCPYIGISRYEFKTIKAAKAFFNRHRYLQKGNVESSSLVQ